MNRIKPLLFLVALLTLPSLVALRLAATIPVLILSGYALVMSLLAYWLVGADKKKAQQNLRRTPEATLHLMELIGGWPGSFLAQHHFRHKIAKLRYQATFWCIIVIYQVVCFDYLNQWQYSVDLISWFKR